MFTVCQQESPIGYIFLETECYY